MFENWEETIPASAWPSEVKHLTSTPIFKSRKNKNKFRKNRFKYAKYLYHITWKSPSFVKMRKENEPRIFIAYSCLKYSSNFLKILRILRYSLRVPYR